jgi:hypothetical protein
VAVVVLVSQQMAQMVALVAGQDGVKAQEAVAQEQLVKETMLLQVIVAVQQQVVVVELELLEVLETIVKVVLGHQHIQHGLLQHLLVQVVRMQVVVQAVETIRVTILCFLVALEEAVQVVMAVELEKMRV